MKKTGSCDNTHHKTVTDYVGREIICEDCGIVLEEQSNALRQELSVVDERELIITQAMPEKKGMITNLGTQMSYISHSEQGQIFKDSNPYNVRDYLGKKCLPLIQSNMKVPLQIGKMFQGRGEWDASGMKFIIDYKLDKWYREQSNKRFELCKRYDIMDSEPRLAEKDLQGYSVLILDIMIEIITRLDIHTMHRLKREHRDENRAVAVRYLEELGSILSRKLDRGDRIADGEDGIDTEDDWIPKKRISITEGQEQYFVDEDFDLGRI